MFSKKASKNDKIFTVKLTVKILSFFVAFLENMNFKILSDVKKYFFQIFVIILGISNPRDFMQTFLSIWIAEDKIYNILVRLAHSK